MEATWKSTIEQNASLVILSFLEVDSSTVNYDKELSSLGSEISRDINCNGILMHTEDDGDLETDGHISSRVSMFLGDIQPSVRQQVPGKIVIK